MSETKFTPGPWRIGDHGEEVVSEKDIDGDIIADAPRDWEHSMENWPANAKLIAAAPDLLQCLIDCVENILIDFPDDDERKVKYVKAIAKATE